MSVSLPWKERQKYSLFFNLLVVGLEVISFIIILITSHRIPVEYYTVDSNLLTLISCAIFIVFMIRGREIPRWLKLLKYISVTSLAITFIVVIFILAPMYHFNYGYLLFHNELLYQHLLCPIFGMATFFMFDNFSMDNILAKKPRLLLRNKTEQLKSGELTASDEFYAISFTIIYGIVMATLNIAKVIDGPYPFLRVYEQPLLASIIWALVLFLSSYLVAVCLRKVRNIML